MAATLVFLATIVVSLLGLYASPKVVERAILRPYWLQKKGQYDRLLTCGFVHADIPHLFFNMMTFYFFAFAMERYVGTARFVLLYFSGLVLSNIGVVVKHRDDPNYATLGASGAILAVMFASIVYSPHQSLFIIPIPVPIPAPLFAVGYLIYSYYSARNAKGRINHDAHFAGALTGLAFVAVTDPAAYEQLAGMLGFGN
jgi:membrane associated rhomboid family serine protease